MGVEVFRERFWRGEVFFGDDLRAMLGRLREGGSRSAVMKASRLSVDIGGRFTVEHYSRLTVRAR